MVKKHEGNKMNSIIKKSNTLLKDNCVIYTFKYNIEEIVSINNLIVVLLNTPMNSNYNENLLCVNSSGDFIWQVERVAHIYDDSPFTNIVPVDEKHIKSYNQDGFMYTIDIHTGKIIKKSFMK